jgi:hypothetical protein
MTLRMAILLMLLAASPALAHDIYTDWRMPDQRDNDGKRVKSCCNNNDCKPRASRWVGDHWEVQWGLKWLRVPDGKVETSYADAWSADDHQSHACINVIGNVLCFRPGEWLQ